MLAVVLWAALQQPAPNPPPPQEPDKKKEKSILDEDEGFFGKGVTFVPIPFFSTSRNNGASYGLLPVFMFNDDKGDINKLIVPKIEYFDASSVNFSVDFFGFPTENSFYDFFALKAIRDDEKYIAEYRNSRVADSDWAVYAELYYAVSNSERFFGIGPTTKEDNETNYLARDRRGKVGVGYHVFDHAVLYFQERIRKFSMSPGALDLPSSKGKFPNTPGFDEGTIVHEELRWAYDDRDSAKTPSKGTTATVWLSLRHYFGHEGNAPGSAPIWGGGFEVSSLWAHDKEKIFITAARVRYEFIKGESGEVPFIEMVTYGGNTMRGYGSDRFVDLNGFLFSLEERVNVLDILLFGVKGHIEVAPFLDTGKVFHDTYHDLLIRPGRDYQYTGGLAVRGVVPPFIVGRVEFGFGLDGMAAFVGLDYPY